MSGRPPRITLLTDFGTADGYVAAMKGVIAGILPDALMDDASHDIPPGDIHAASWALGAYWRLYPPGTVHVAVVDPGVGSTRRPLALDVDDRFIVAPDNGIVSGVLRQSRLASAIEIAQASSSPTSPTSPISPTFHGRDVFAPAAARLAAGVPLLELGSVVTDPILLDDIVVVQEDSVVTGVVVHVDRFGNLVTNIPASAAGPGRVEVGDAQNVPVVRTYSDVERGACAALIGSRGTLEVTVRDGRAVEVLGVGRGAKVVWREATR